MRETFASLGRFTVISLAALGMATVSNFLSYQKYWNGTIFAVQTVDFNILSHTLPTKLSILLSQGNKEEIQRTLNSNYGLFGIVVTDCQKASLECPQQKILYSSKPSFRWQQQLQADNFQTHPYDVLRNPPPVYAEGHFKYTNFRKRQPTGQTNSGIIIGRVYYIRSKPPTFIEDYFRWVRNPSSFAGVNVIYSLTVALFMLAGFSTWRALERVLHQKRVLLEQSQHLQQELQEKIQLLPVLLDQREQARVELERYREEQQQRTHQLTQTIARYEAQLTEQEQQQRSNAQTLKQLQQELADFQQREVAALSDIQQREQAIITLRQAIAKQELEQREKAQTLEKLQRELSLAQQWQVDAQGQLQQRELAVADLKHQIATQHQQQQENAKTLEQLQGELTQVQQHYTAVQENLQQSQCAIANLECQIDTAEEEKQEKVGLLTALRQDLQDVQQRESEARRQAQKLSQMITALTSERDQALQKFHELEQFHRAAVPNIDKLSTALKEAKTELEQARQFKEYALEDNEILKSENERLKSEKEQLGQKQDDAQLQIWELEEQVEYYLKYFSEFQQGQFENTVAGFFDSGFNLAQEAADLSGLRLALVGGHQAVRREVIHELIENYRLKNYVEIPPSNEAYISRSDVQAKISNCDLIAVITRFMGHDLSYIISGLQKDGALTGQVLWLNCKGRTGVIREILAGIKASGTESIPSAPVKAKSLKA